MFLKKGGGTNPVAPAASVLACFHVGGATLFRYPALVKLVSRWDSGQHFQRYLRFPGEHFSNDSILPDELCGNPFRKA